MSELQKALDRIAKMDLSWPDKQVAASKEVEHEIATLTKQVEELREALLDAQPAVELLNELVEETGVTCGGPDHSNFELCNHGICARIGCTAQKVQRVADTLANTEKDTR